MLKRHLTPGGPNDDIRIAAIRKEGDGDGYLYAFVVGVGYGTDGQCARRAPIARD